MRSLMIVGLLFAFAAATAEGAACNVYHMTQIQIDFCNYAEVVTDLLPGMITTGQLEKCIAEVDQEMCRPINDCPDSEELINEALALLEDIINDDLCVDPCLASPCVHGSCTRLSAETYTCLCDDGYSGNDCEIDIDECATVPCLNNAVCIDMVNAYSCTCAAGFEGTHCEINIDECVGHECLNGAACVDGINSYTCTCVPGYAGDRCETDINECAPEPCQNGGVCTDGINSYSCSCLVGYEGDNCETNTDDCASDPCLNGAECVDGVASVTCICAEGFQGEFCEEHINYCEPNPCFNGGECTNTLPGFACTCPETYQGETCEEDVDECIESPCVNGECVNHDGGFSCSCEAGFEGTLCDTTVSSGPDCYTKADGSDYRGEASTTVNGYPCQAWVNTHPNRVEDFAHFLFRDHSNFCRNWEGSGKSGPWCYTNLEAVEWEYCEGIPTETYDRCSDAQPIEAIETSRANFAAIGEYTAAECYVDPTGLDYTGYVSVTVEGFTCQRWDVNFPNMRDPAKKSKPRHNHILFGAHNYCRTNGAGPGGATTGPWCWIADESAGKSWDYCNTTQYLQAECADKGEPISQLRMGMYPECMLTAFGADYEGNMNVAESGLPCLAWSDLPKGSKYNDIFSSQGDKCRSFDFNTDPWKRPWCFTSQTTQEKCRVKDHYDQCFAGTCEYNACKNGAGCVDGADGYTCTCPEGYTGDYCDIEIDECATNPCLNGGVCVDLFNAYECVCIAGFDGDNCGNNIDECVGHACLNGAACVDGINGYTCTCATGFTGRFCGTNIDDCANSPCLNGGVCVDLVNAFSCTCLPGFDGENCQNRLGSGPDCYTKADGSDYRGEASTTVSGFPCQNWANTHPNRVEDFAHFLFRDHSNFCRNWEGSGKSGPWCYTNLEEVEWEYCEGVPTETYDRCTDAQPIDAIETSLANFAAIGEYTAAECYVDPLGLDYTGYLSVTVEGLLCQRWDINYPRKRDPAQKSKPRHNHILFGAHNYCRTDGVGPEGIATTGPWCWIADATSEKAWDYCDTTPYLQSECADKGTPTAQPRLGIYPECMLTSAGTDYEGNMDVTESGLSCLNWADLTEDTKYHDLGEHVGNKCRTFSMDDPYRRPWCFTSQTEQEKCRVKDLYDQCFPATTA